MCDKLNDALFGNDQIGVGESEGQMQMSTNQCVYMQNSTTSAVFNFKESHQQREDIQEMINKIPFPQDDDLSVTSYSSSNTTPQKFLFRGKSQKVQAFQPQEDEEKEDNYFPNTDHMQDLTMSQMSMGDNHTPQQSQIANWNKQHVNPQSKNLFPQVIAPSMDFTNDNASSLNFALQNLNREPQNKDFKHQKKSFEMPNLYNKENYNSNLTHSPNIEYDENEEINISYTSKVSLSDNPIQRGDPIQRQVDKKKNQLMQEVTSCRSADIEKEMRNKDKILQQYEQQFSYLGQQISELEEKCAFLQEKYKDKSSLEILRGKNLENTKIQLQQVKSLGEQKDQKIYSLQQQVQQYVNKEKVIEGAIEKELTELYGEIEKQRVVMETYSKQVQKLERANNDLKKYNEQGIGENSKRVEDLNEQIEQLLIERNEMLEEHQNKHNSIEQYQQYSRDLSEKLKQSQENEQTGNKQIRELKQKLEGYQMAEVGGTKLMHDKSKEDMNQKLRDEIVRVRQSYEKQIAKMKQEAEERLAAVPDNRILDQQSTNSVFVSDADFDLKQKFSYTEEMLEEAQQKLLYQSQEIKQLKNEKSLMEVQLHSYKLELMQDDMDKNQEYYQKQLDDLQQKYVEEIQEKEAEIDPLKNKLKNHSQSILEKDQLIYQFKLQFKQKEEELEDIYAKFEELEFEKMNLSKTLQAERKKQGENSSYQKDYDQLQNVLQDKMSEVKHLVQYGEQMQQELEKTKNFHLGVVKKLEKLNLDLSQKNDSLQGQINDLQSSQRQSQNSDQAFRQLEEKYNQQSHLIKEKDKKNIELFNQNKNYSENQKKIDESLKQLQQDFDKTRRQLSQKQQENKVLTERNKEIQAKTHDSSQEKNYQRLIHDLECHEVEFQQMREMFTNKILEMGNQINQLQRENSDLAQENQDLMQVNQQQLIETKNSLMYQSNVSQQRSHEQEFQQMRDMFTKKIVEMGNKINQMERVNQDLTQENQLQRVESKNSMMYQSNVSQQSSFQPEMLSNEETLDFMMNVMRRVSTSNVMIKSLLKSDEFRQLLTTIQETSFYVDDNYYFCQGEEEV